MTILSKLRPSDIRLANLAANYASHRPIIQRCLTSGFVLYVLGTTYRGLSARPNKPPSTKGKRTIQGGIGRTPRVAVSVERTAFRPSSTNDVID